MLFANAGQINMRSKKLLYEIIVRKARRPCEVKGRNQIQNTCRGRSCSNSQVVSSQLLHSKPVNRSGQRRKRVRRADSHPLSEYLEQRLGKRRLEVRRPDMRHTTSQSISAYSMFLPKILRTVLDRLK
jgi:hypothetical protein